MIGSRSTLQAKLFRAFTLVTIIAAALPAVFSRNMLQQERLDLAGRQALAQATLLRGLLEAGIDGPAQAALLASVKEAGLRMTVTGEGGVVALDSHVGEKDLPELDNHNDRPEIESARMTGQGVSLRHSNTLGIDAMYAAVALADNRVLRLAVPLAGINRSLEKELSSMSLAVAGVAAFCLALSIIITRRFRNGMDSMAEVVADMARHKGGRRLLRVPGREFLPLALAVNRMAENIEDYVRTTTDQQTQLELILDSMHEGILVLGPSGNIRRYNRAMAALFPVIADCMGKQLIEGIPMPILQRKVQELFREESAAPLPTASQRNDAGEESDAIHFEQDGRFLVAHISRPVQHNPALGAVIVIYDATHIMRLERVRRDFVANVSHELRTPLTAITGYAETLMGLEDVREEHRKFAGIIHKHARMLAKVIGDLLELARIEDRREKIRFSSVDPAEPLAEAIRLCGEEIEAKRLRIVCDLENGVRVLGNASLLTQVLRNLLENAGRYSPEAGEIAVSCSRQGNEALFSVKDQGPGIPQDELPRIFERLYQVKKQRNSGSSGIGLAICKHIIERHGGRIWAESPCQGFATAMLFTLPLSETSEKQEQ